jgi:hypothetical protein
MAIQPPLETPPESKWRDNAVSLAYEKATIDMQAEKDEEPLQHVGYLFSVGQATPEYAGKQGLTSSYPFVLRKRATRAAADSSIGMGDPSSSQYRSRPLVTRTALWD